MMRYVLAPMMLVSLLAASARAQAAGMELGPGEDPCHGALVGGSAGAPRRRAERLRHLEGRAPGRGAAAPEASPRGSRERLDDIMAEHNARRAATSWQKIATPEYHQQAQARAANQRLVRQRVA